MNEQQNVVFCYRGEKLLRLAIAFFSIIVSFWIILRLIIISCWESLILLSFDCGVIKADLLRSFLTKFLVLVRSVSNQIANYE